MDDMNTYAIESPRAPLSDPEDIIVLLKLYQKETGLSAASLARTAGLHYNSLNRLNDPKWRPRLDTLKHLYAWLSGIGRPESTDGEIVFITEPSLDPVAIEGDEGGGWHLIYDGGQWWISTKTGRYGPYDTARAAAADARAPR